MNKPRQLKKTVKSDGRNYVKIEGKSRRVDELMMLTFGPPKPHPNSVIIHIDGDDTSDHKDNLRWSQPH